MSYLTWIPGKTALGTEACAEASFTAFQPLSYRVCRHPLSTTWTVSLFDSKGTQILSSKGHTSEAAGRAAAEEHYRRQISDLSCDIGRVAAILDDTPPVIPVPLDQDIPDHLDWYIEQLNQTIDALRNRIRDAKVELGNDRAPSS